ncbi:MAG: efflux RND transporter periplasmic adaptor subunit [Myxococcales bacterium]|nr:efflux RND transporter periplasmic adaptor subunit [Myxococcales bacterium]
MDEPASPSPSHASTPSAPHPAGDDEPRPARSHWLAKLLLALCVAGLGVLIATRVAATLAERARRAEERDKIAAQAKEESGTLALAVVRPEPITWQPHVPLEGTLYPVAEVDLAFKVGGTLAKLHVRKGARVAADEPLAELDASDALLQERAASAQIAAAEAQLFVARDNVARTGALLGAGALPEAMGTQAKGQLDLVAAQLEGARAQQALARSNIEHHRLRAPFAGLVTQAPTAIGGLVAPGVPVFHLQDLRKLRLVGTVATADAPLMREGALLELELGGRTIRGAKLTVVLPTLDPATRRLPVEAEVPNDADAPLLAGSFVQTTVVGAEPLVLLRLPAAALRPGSQDEIFVVEGGTLRLRRIAYVRANDGALLVRQGLANAEVVALAPPPDAEPGQSVTTLADAAAPAAGEP